MIYWVNEIIGYTGMAFVLCSFLFKDIKWLRLLNVIGGSLCCVYGFLTETYPTAILNILLVFINISFPFRYVIKNRKKEEKDEDC